MCSCSLQMLAGQRPAVHRDARSGQSPRRSRRGHPASASRRRSTSRSRSQAPTRSRIAQAVLDDAAVTRRLDDAGADASRRGAATSPTGSGPVPRPGREPLHGPVASAWMKRRRVRLASARRTEACSSSRSSPRLSTLIPRSYDRPSYVAYALSSYIWLRPIEAAGHMACMRRAEWRDVAGRRQPRSGATAGRERGYAGVASPAAPA